MAFFISRVKTVLFSHKDAQNAQKLAKNDQKSVLFDINTPFRIDDRRQTIEDRWQKFV